MALRSPLCIPVIYRRGSAEVLGLIDATANCGCVVVWPKSIVDFRATRIAAVVILGIVLNLLSWKAIPRGWQVTGSMGLAVFDVGIRRSWAVNGPKRIIAPNHNAQPRSSRPYGRSTNIELL